MGLRIGVSKRFVLAMGIVLIGIPVLVVGQKLFEHLTYSVVQATVMAVDTKCEMTPQGSRSNKENLVACDAVPMIKALRRDVQWTVDRVPVVTVSYPMADNQSATSTVPLRRLWSDPVQVGQVIPVLRSPEPGGELTDRVTPSFFALCAAMLAFGLLLVGVWRHV